MFIRVMHPVVLPVIRVVIVAGADLLITQVDREKERPPPWKMLLMWQLQISPWGPSKTYTNLKEKFLTNCAIVGCHQPANLGAGPNWTNYETFIARVDDTVGSTNNILNLNANTTVAQLLDTFLFINACSADNHLGGNQLCITDLHKAAPTSALQLSPLGRDILQWLEEGARDN